MAGAVSTVWVVVQETGAYSDFSYSVMGVFATEALARMFCAQEGGCVVYPLPLLSEPARPVTHYRWSDHIAASGEISPMLGKDHFRYSGRTRDSSPSWEHLEVAVKGEIHPWNAGRDLYVEVTGTDLDAVRAEHARLVEEAKARLFSDTLATQLATSEANPEAETTS